MSLNNAGAGISFSLDDNKVPYYYDTVRDKWLGELEWDGAGKNGSHGTGYLRRFNGMTMTHERGIYIPYNIVIVGLSMANSADVSGDLEVHRNGTHVSTLAFDGKTGSNMTLNDDFAGGGVMSFFTDDLSGNLSNPQIRCWFRRKG